nr:response regulator [Deltaproteobacteria bacterium]
MVRRLLGLARHDLSEVKVLNLNTLVLEEVLLLERTTLAQVRFSLDLANDLRPVRGDSTALIHALMNLCVNAIDAMPHGGTLTLRTRNAEPGWIELEIVDSGIGMPREVLDKAMDPFFTTKSHGKGTGLGLSMAYNTMKAHRGTLTIQSETGKGTRVLVRLPSCEGEEPEDEAPAPSKQEGNGRSLEVLLVDDDELIRDSIGPVLRAQGHRVVLVASGEEALDRMKRGSPPDVVILDMNMPGLGGRGALPRIRSLQPDVPVLLATGRAGPDALELTRTFTGVTLLPKPINASDLKAYLDTLQAKPDR